MRNLGSVMQALGRYALLLKGRAIQALLRTLISNPRAISHLRPTIVEFRCLKPEPDWAKLVNVLPYSLGITVVRSQPETVKVYLSPQLVLDTKYAGMAMHRLFFLGRVYTPFLEKGPAARYGEIEIQEGIHKARETIAEIVPDIRIETIKQSPSPKIVYTLKFSVFAIEGFIVPVKVRRLLIPHVIRAHIELMFLNALTRLKPEGIY